LQSNIDNLSAQLKDPILKQLDDDYKQDYVNNKQGFFDDLKKTWRNYMSGFTYDQYKDIVAERNRQQDVDQYYNTLVENRTSKQKDNGSAFLY
jgi:hypothetical protein